MKCHCCKKPIPVELLRKTKFRLGGPVFCSTSCQPPQSAQSPSDYSGCIIFTIKASLAVLIIWFMFWLHELDQKRLTIPPIVIHNSDHAITYGVYVRSRYGWGVHWYEYSVPKK